MKKALSRILIANLSILAVALVWALCTPQAALALTNYPVEPNPGFYGGGVDATARTALSNNLTAAFQAGDVAATGSVSTAYLAADTALSNNLVAADTAVSNALAVLLVPQQDTNTVANPLNWTPRYRGDRLQGSVSNLSWEAFGSTTNDWVALN